MSYYTKQLHLIKCNDSVLPQIQDIIDQYMQHAYDEVYIEMKPELYRGYHLIECSGRKTTFGNFFYRISELSPLFKEWLYLDYDDGCAHCSSNFAKYIFVEDDSKPIAWIEDGADIGELQTQLCKYFNKNDVALGIIKQESSNLYQLAKSLSELNVDVYVRFLECDSDEVWDYDDIDF